MLIEIHVIQNHSPANLNRDDLGAPKTCYFGGVLRSRISSQCIKRSIRMSKDFEPLLGGVATRRLAQLISSSGVDSSPAQRATKILEICGIAPKDRKKGSADDSLTDEDKSAGRVYTSRKAIEEMATLLRNGEKESDQKLAAKFAKLIGEHTAVPDMALFGRMLEPKKPRKDKKGTSADASGSESGEEAEKSDAKGVWKGLNLTVEAACQVAHAISTHEARPEVDYFVAADDIPGEDVGAAYVDEAMFASACFYKYFSIHWETLAKNLTGFGEDHQKLAAHTVGAFIRGVATVNPTGKQNSFAAHNFPDGMLIEIRDSAPISYANAFVKPAKEGERDLVSQSIAQLSQYVHDLDIGYGKPKARLWFSPNMEHHLTAQVRDEDGKKKQQEIDLTEQNFNSLESLIPAAIKALPGELDWADVQKVVVNSEVAA